MAKAPDWLNPSQTVRAVICHIRQGDKFLLQLKSKGRFGEGFWNAPGGKIEPSETAQKAAIREVFEETGLVAKRLEKAGYLEFFFGESKKIPDWTAEVFLCTEFEGEIGTSTEGELKWFDKDAIPYDKMWADDRYWLPTLVEGDHGILKRTFRGRFVFSSDSKVLLNSEIVLTP